MLKTYISLGPSCIPAGILDALGVRRHTYGFDWCRSGSYHLERFLSDELEVFLENEVFRPNHRMRQQVSPSITAYNTGHIGLDSGRYGYGYLYNPHRDINLEETRSYHRRAFARLKKVIHDEVIAKEFLLCDYENKEGYKYFSNPRSDMMWVDSVLQNNGVANYQIHLIRFLLDDAANTSIQHRHESVPAAGKRRLSLHNVKISYILDTEEMRGHTYRVVGKSVLGPCKLEDLYKLN